MLSKGDFFKRNSVQPKDSVSHLIQGDFFKRNYVQPKDSVSHLIQVFLPSENELRRSQVNFYLSFFTIVHSHLQKLAYAFSSSCTFIHVSTPFNQLCIEYNWCYL